MSTEKRFRVNVFLTTVDRTCGHITQRFLNLSYLSVLLLSTLLEASDDEKEMQRLNCWLNSMTRIYRLRLLFQLRCYHFAQTFVRCCQRSQPYSKLHIFYSWIIMNCQHSVMFALPICYCLHCQ